MVANVGPADWNYDETLSTLRSVCRVKGDAQHSEVGCSGWDRDKGGTQHADIGVGIRMREALRMLMSVCV